MVYDMCGRISPRSRVAAIPRLQASEWDLIGDRRVIWLPDPAAPAASSSNDGGLAEPALVLVDIGSPTHVNRFGFQLPYVLSSLTSLAGADSNRLRLGWTVPKSSRLRLSLLARKWGNSNCRAAEPRQPFATSLTFKAPTTINP